VSTEADTWWAEQEEMGYPCPSCGHRHDAPRTVCAICWSLGVMPAPAPDDDAVFVYGTLKADYGNSRCWRAYDGTSRPATAEGITLLGAGRAIPYATEAEHPHGPAVGELVTVPEEGRADAMWEMDALEGVPHHYRRSTCWVTVDGERRPAWVYVQAHDWDDRGMVPCPTNEWNGWRR
jgi:gamma-glutamylcyclotransferase (GGCT)/AIG2-like uncharacterized protein YtfP